MTTNATARDEITSRIETLERQRQRAIEELSKSESFGRKCADDIAQHEALIADWNGVLKLIDAQ